VAVRRSRTSIVVSFSRPTTVSFESTGSSVVRPPGRGPRSTLIATGPCVVNCTPDSYETPGQSSRGAATAAGTRSTAASDETAASETRRRIDPARG
jgi:hypothetical protein